MLHQNITSQIIQAAYKVFHTLGSGFLEKCYLNALVIECQNRFLNVDSQRKLDVFYEKKIVGEYFADLIIDDCVIVELKAVKQIENIHKAQLFNYLKATDIKTGLLINFGSDTLYVKRIVR